MIKTDKPDEGRGVEEPDFDDDDMRIIDEVWAKLYPGSVEKKPEESTKPESGEGRLDIPDIVTREDQDA
jgi:hypothetical protein